MKKRIAIFIGGRSPEHDVSVVSGIQAYQALDRSQYDPFLVYVTLTGHWYVGEGLDQRSLYIPGPEILRGLTGVTLDVAVDPMGRGRLLPKKSGMFSRPQPIVFDVAFLSFHGLFGEDGGFQGLFEAAGVAYTGMRLMGTSVLMDKAATKRMLAGTDVPMLPYVIIDRPKTGGLPTAAAIREKLGSIALPVIVKPAHLGSSIGIARATTVEEIVASLPAIFKLDHQAIIEPFVENLVEYNVAVCAAFGDGVRTSAIERPKRASELLDFKQKYMSGGGKKMADGGSGQKVPGQSSQGMLSLTRDINPELPDGIEDRIRGWAETVFTTVGGTGAPRFDFMSDEKTGMVWFNEANPIPGSFGYFLWEAVKGKPVLFSEFLNALINEAIEQQRRSALPADPTLPDARLFPRPFNS